jgi:acylphosphatase
VSVKRVRVTVGGRVQGVFFRATCAERARDLGLSGSVRNLRDGRVESVFEGDDSAVERMIEWCRRGPELAVVDEVEVIAEAPQGDSGFRVEG